jgi:hypothetical protein
MRPRLTYANVMATIAVFIALGGSAYAFHLGKNSVGTKQIKKNAITGAKVKNDSLTGSDINESTLGTIPNAQALDGMSAAQITDASKLRCPSGTKLALGVCFEMAAHTSGSLFVAIHDCLSDNRRLPSEGELIVFQSQTFLESPPLEWTEPMYFVTEMRGMAVSADSIGSLEFSAKDAEQKLPYRCVTMPTN